MFCEIRALHRETESEAGDPHNDRVSAGWLCQPELIAGGVEPSQGSTSDQIGGQATKGTRRMPWRQVAMKDVVSCEKLRGVANRLRSGDLRMGKPDGSHIPSRSG